MITVGIVLMIIGFLTQIAILWSLGTIVLVVGLVLWLLGAAGHAVVADGITTRQSQLLGTDRTALYRHGAAGGHSSSLPQSGRIEATRRRLQPAGILSARASAYLSRCMGRHGCADARRGPAAAINDGGRLDGRTSLRWI